MKRFHAAILAIAIAALPSMLGAAALARAEQLRSRGQS